MTHVKSKLNYKKIFLTFILPKVILFPFIFIAALYFLDKEDKIFTTMLSEQNITYHYTKRAKVLRLSGLYYEYTNPNFIYKNKENTIQAASLKLRLGGNWKTWFKAIFSHKIYLTIPSSLLIQAQEHDEIPFNLSAPNLNIAFNKKSFDLQSDFFSTKMPHQQININNIRYHLKINKKQNSSNNNNKDNIYSSQINTDDMLITYNNLLNLRYASLDALFSIMKNADVKEGNSYKILLEHLAVQPALEIKPPALLKLSGAINYPTLSGHLTITLSHWYTLMMTALDKNKHLTALNGVNLQPILEQINNNLEQRHFNKNSDLSVSFDINPETLSIMQNKISRIMQLVLHSPTP